MKKIQAICIAPFQTKFQVQASGFELTRPRALTTRRPTIHIRVQVNLSLFASLEIDLWNSGIFHEKVTILGSDRVNTKVNKTVDMINKLTQIEYKETSKVEREIESRKICEMEFNYWPRPDRIFSPMKKQVTSVKRFLISLSSRFFNWAGPASIASLDLVDIVYTKACLITLSICTDALNPRIPRSLYTTDAGLKTTFPGNVKYNQLYRENCG